MNPKHTSFIPSYKQLQYQGWCCWGVWACMCILCVGMYLILGHEIISTLIKKIPLPSGILSSCHLQCQHRLGDGKGWDLGCSGAADAIVPQQDGLSLCFSQSFSLPSSLSPVLVGVPHSNGNPNSCGMICKEPQWPWAPHATLARSLSETLTADGAVLSQHH